MYIAFTEEQAMEIRKLGISVVEYKLCLKKCIAPSWYAVKKVMRRAAESFKILSEALAKLAREFATIADNANEICGNVGKPKYRCAIDASKCQIKHQDLSWKNVRECDLHIRNDC